MTPVHEHDYELCGVDFTDGGEVREFECGTCGSVWFN